MPIKALAEELPVRSTQNGLLMTLNLKELTLAVVTSKKFWRDPEGIKTTGGAGRQIEEFSKYFAKTVLVVPFEFLSRPKPGYIVRDGNIEIVPLPYFDGAGLKGKLDSLMKAPQISKQIWSAYNNCDLLSYWLSGYVGLIGLTIHKLRKAKPGFAYIATDWPDRIIQTRNTFPRQVMARFVASMIPWLIRDVPIFALGHIAQKYRALNAFVHSDVQSTLSRADIDKTIDKDFNQPLSLLFVGRLAAEKGLNYLIEAISLCRIRQIKCQLTIVGDGKERVKLEEMVEQYGLKDHICFKGYIPLGENLWDQYRKADVFVLPSVSEALGKVLIEAMANGLIIIATRVGGIPSLIEDRVNGLLVEPRSPEAVADAIQHVSEQPAIGKKLANNALTTAHAYTVEEQTERLMQSLAQDLAAQGWQIGV